MRGLPLDVDRRTSHPPTPACIVNFILSWQYCQYLAGLHDACPCPLPAPLGPIYRPDPIHIARPGPPNAARPAGSGQALASHPPRSAAHSPGEGAAAYPSPPCHLHSLMAAPFHLAAQLIHQVPCHDGGILIVQLPEGGGSWGGWACTARTAPSFGGIRANVALQGVIQGWRGVSCQEPRPSLQSSRKSDPTSRIPASSS